MKTLKRNIRQELDKEISNVIKHSGINNYHVPATGVTYSDFLNNKLLMIQVIREGVPYSLFSLIQNFTPFSEENWSRFLDISTKTLQRYKASPKNFKPIHSEKIIEMAEVTNIGLDVFGDMEKFKLWLDTPNFALGSIKPMELLMDSYGKEMVISELIRINYGILV